MSGYSTGDQDWRREPENQPNVVPFQSFGAFVPEQWATTVPSLRISHEYSVRIKSLTTTGKECFMEKAGLQRCPVPQGHCLLSFFLSDKHQWRWVSTQVAANVVQKVMKDRVRSLDCWQRSYEHMHAQGIQFCWLFLFALSPPEGKKMRQVEELKGLLSCKRCKRREEGKRRRGNGQKTGIGWGKHGGAPCGRTVQQACMHRWVCHECALASSVAHK